MTTAEAPVVQITLPPLHPKQEEIAKDETRFRVVACGRRWGKTLMASVVLLRAALKGGRVWHVAPTYKQTMECWDYIMRVVPQLPRGICEIHMSDKKFSFASGGSIELRTADNPNNLRGAGLDGVVIDEAAMLKPDAWELVLRPALADRRGWALFISTPQHFNWFYDLFAKGEQGEKDWRSWQQPTWTNPFIPQEEIDAAQRDMEQEDFDQEFGASFTAIGGAIFPSLSANRPVYLRPMPAGLSFRRVGVGMDWGTTKQHNAAVVCGGVTTDGSVWIRSAWLDWEHGDQAWIDEAARCHRDYGASFARVDRSQSSALGRLTQPQAVNGAGLDEAQTGVADVEARIGAYQGLIRPVRIFFDLNGPGVREYYNHLCEYHRIPEGMPKAGTPEEVNDDDVDAGGYLVAELVGGYRMDSTTVRLHGLPQRPSVPTRRTPQRWSRSY